MDIAVTAADAEATADAAAELIRTLRGRRTLPDFCTVHASATYDIAEMQQLLAATQLPSLHGATSCRGVMANGAMVSQNGRGAGCLAIWDPEGSYGTALADVGENPTEAARDATRNALAHAERIGEAPDLVWISASPGHEEAIIAGIQSVVGANTPIVGGSAADDDVSGNWRVFDAHRVRAEALVVSVLFPSRPLSTAYQNGYAPTGARGVATRVSGRTLLEIDGRPASTVYAEWTRGSVDIPAARPAHILAQSTFHPLGCPLVTPEGIPYYLLAHPICLHGDGGIDLFCEIAEGDAVELMVGSAESLGSRAGRVASLASIDGSDCAGALVVYCAGCRLAMRDGMDAVAKDVHRALGESPSLGIFSFGEQGQTVGGQNRHGNLMISCIAFAR